MFTKVAAVELGQYKIRVNCVAPGAIEIERTKNEAGDYAATWSKLTPLGRVGKPRDVGRMVAFLASDSADFISGQTMWVDGGLFASQRGPTIKLFEHLTVKPSRALSCNNRVSAEFIQFPACNCGP